LTDMPLNVQELCPLKCGIL